MLRSVIRRRGPWAVVFLLALLGAPRSSQALAPDATDQSSLAGLGKRALVVQGEYDALRAPSDAGLAPPSALTAEAWIKREPAAGCGTILGRGRSSGWWFGVCDGRLRFTPGGGTTGAATAASVLPEGRWVHVAATYDGDTARFFVDGRADGVARIGRGLTRVATELGIGADAELGAVMAGKIDLARLWAVERSAAEIGAARWAPLPRQPGLVAEWPLDGSGRDLVGGHDAEALGGASFSFDGIQPGDVHVPLRTVAVNVDGRCDASEYGGASRVALDTLDAPQVLLQTSATDVFVCLANVKRAAGGTGNAALYLDRNASASAVAETGDLRLMINARGTRQTDEGDGRGGWRRVDLLDADWGVAYDAPGGVGAQAERWSAEFRVRRSLLDRPATPDRPVTFGVAIGASERNLSGIDVFWPYGVSEASPATWAVAELAETEGIPPRGAFSGRVVRALEDGRVEGLGGAVVQLLAADEQRLTLLDEATTDEGGVWSLDFAGLLPDAFIVREIDPPGVTSVSARAGAAGEARGANVLYFAREGDAPATGLRVENVTFTDRIGLSEPAPLGRHLWIVVAPPVSADDVAALVRARRLQGFDVTVEDVATIERSVPGRDRAARIQRWLRDRWAVADAADEPAYALLVGRGDAIPVRDIGWLDTDHRDPNGPSGYPAWPTDWYYADLDSGWDANGNGFHGEFLRCAPGTTYADPAAKDGRRDCPEAGSLSREGPFGALRGPEDDYLADIAVGRLAVNTPAEVRAAVASVLRAESDGLEAKRRALVAGGFWSFEGRSRIEAERRYVPGGSASADPWLGAPWDGQKPYGHDSADGLEAAFGPRARAAFDEVYRLYETTSPGGNPALAPSRFSPDAPLSRAALAGRLQSGRAGLVALAAPGGPDALVAAHWLRDWDGNGQIEQPASDFSCAGSPIPELGITGPPCPELFTERLLDGGLAAPGGAPPVVVANAGETAAVAYALDGLDANGGVSGLRFGPSALAATLPVRGAASAWIGSYGAIVPGALDGFTADVVAGLAANPPLRLGDATWRAASAAARGAPYDMRAYGTGLFGDPSANYWGESADAVGAWPQDGGSWHARGANGRSGPAQPVLAWVAGAARLSSPPIIGRDGSLVALADANLQRMFPSGAASRAIPLGGVFAGQAIHAPAATNDGYVVAAGTQLLRFGADLTARRGVVLPSAAVAAPRLDADGDAWVPTAAGMVRVTATGSTSYGRYGGAAGPAVVVPTGDVAWTTDRGTLVRWTRADDETTEIAGPGLGRLTAPVVGRDETLYVGSDDGRVYAFPPERAPWNARVGSAVTARPTLGADGTLYAVGRSGVVVAFAAGSPVERWRETVDGAGLAPLAVDGTQVYVAAGAALAALDVATGAPAWSQPLGGGTDARSGPILGADRRVYVVRQDGALVAVGESGWQAAPSDVALDFGAPAGGATITWRDNGAGDAAFRVSLCRMDGACVDAGTAAAGASRLVLTRLPVPAGEPVWARVQAIAPGAAAFALQPGEARRPSDLGVSEPVVPPVVGASEPSGLTATVLSAEAVRLEWTMAGDTSGLLGFTVRRRVDGGASADVAFLPADARSWIDRDLRAGQTATWQLATHFEAGSAAAPEVTARTRTRSTRGPGDLRALGGRESILLTWRDEVSAETGWIVERRDPGTARYAVVGRLGPDANRFVDTLWLAEGRYHYRVYATLAETTSPVATVGADVTTRDRVRLFMPIATAPR